MSDKKQHRAINRRKIGNIQWAMYPEVVRKIVDAIDDADFGEIHFTLDIIEPNQQIEGTQRKGQTVNGVVSANVKRLTYVSPIPKTNIS